MTKTTLPMTGLVEAAQFTQEWCKRERDDIYIQISYDRSDGEILTTAHNDFAHNSWTQYHSKSVITVSTTTRPMTEDQIKKTIEEAVERFEIFERQINT